MLKLRPDARAVVMYAPLEDYLTSLAKKGFDGRRWGRDLFMGMRRERLLERIQFSDVEFLGLIDLQIAACAWLGQQQLFADLLNAFPERVRSLESRAFLDHPDDAVKNGARLFGFDLSSDQIESVKANVLTRNSKDGKAFSRGAREADYRAARSTYGDEVEKVAKWATLVADAAGIPTELPEPLA
jgi:hypothetical protein